MGFEEKSADDSEAGSGHVQMVEFSSKYLLVQAPAGPSEPPFAYDDGNDVVEGKAILDEEVGEAKKLFVLSVRFT